MDLKLYINKSEKNKLDKTISNETLYTGQLKSETSILNPSILIEGVLNNLVSYNYAQIPMFNRYYFITDIISVRNNLIQINLRVDVLMSYKTQILTQQAVIERQQNDFNVYLDDPNYKVYNYSRVTTKNFPNSFLTNPVYILSVNGG